MAENKLQNQAEEREMTAEETNEQRQIRIDKLVAMQEAGCDPYEVMTAEQTHHSVDAKAAYEEHEAKLLAGRTEPSVEGLDEQAARQVKNEDYNERRAIMDADPINVAIAGRMLFKRVMGKASFCNIQDKMGNIQVYVSRDSIGDDNYADFKKSDIGDIFAIKGYLFRTKTGEVSVHANDIHLISKSLLPLPEKFHGLKDTDTRYRQRYVDLIVNPEVKDTFIKRAKIITSVRKTLDDIGYVEVETPVLNTIAGGATARPFITHHNTLDMDMYLRIATELPLKRLIVGGMERVYEIGRIFRNEGMDPKHNPEFTTIEFYEAYTDYNGMMDRTEAIIRNAALAANGTYKVTFKGVDIDLEKPFARMTMAEAVKKYTGIDFEEFACDHEKAIALAKEKGIELEKGKETWGDILVNFYDEFVEANLEQPTFIMDYPVEVSPLTKRKPSKPYLTERFELFILGTEYGNAYTELNDPLDQMERFKHQLMLRDCGDEEANMLDDDFVRALEYGMPPTGGCGIGIDRLVMLLTNNESIRDVLLFPTMKPEGKAAKTVKKSAEATKSTLTREQALELLKKYNKDPFHIRHGLTVEAVMRWFAKELGYAEEEEFWGQVGLLHDIDFELYPEEHCQKAPELLKEGGANDELIHGVVSHGYGQCSDVEPEHEMEKVLFAADELTGLIWSYALMREGKSAEGMEVSGLKKKFKDKKFAAGCSRDVIKEGAERLGWELTDLFDKTIKAMQESEKAVNEACL
ncbi:MAG: lysine--tRNA ligase [Clostridiales bacterium]|nr:lysine--tRNA ligase [Candidatus Crickella equi]